MTARYETSKTRHENIKKAIMATNPRTGAGIFIDLFAVVESSDKKHENYTIKHGNYFPKVVENGRVLKATWDEFFISGHQDYKNGFQTLDHIKKFLESEIKRLEKRVQESIISNDYESEMVSCDRWKLVLKAWKTFQKKFLAMRKAGKIMDIKQAKEVKQQLEN